MIRPPSNAEFSVVVSRVRPSSAVEDSLVGAVGGDLPAVHVRVGHLVEHGKHQQVEQQGVEEGHGAGRPARQHQLTL